MQQQVLTTVSLIAVDLSPAMLFCSTNELRQSAVDSLGVQITIKVPNFFQFKSEQISIFTCVSCTQNNLWYTSYRHNYLVMHYLLSMHYL